MQNFGGTNKEYYGIFEMAYMVFFLLFPLIGLHDILCPIGQFSKQHGF